MKENKIDVVWDCNVTQKKRLVACSTNPMHRILFDLYLKKEREILVSSLERCERKRINTFRSSPQQLTNKAEIE